METAEEYCNSRLGFEQYPTDTPYFMIEFAKMHVEAALKAASEKCKTKSKSYKRNLPGYSATFSKEIIDKKSILNSYSLTNIR